MAKQPETSTRWQYHTEKPARHGWGEIFTYKIVCMPKPIVFTQCQKKILNKYFEFKPLRVLYFLLQFVRFCFDFLINFDNCKIIFQKMVIAWAWVTCLVLVHAVPFVGVKQEQSKHTGLSLSFSMARWLRACSHLRTSIPESRFMSKHLIFLVWR